MVCVACPWMNQIAVTENRDSSRLFPCAKQIPCLPHFSHAQSHIDVSCLHNS